MTKMLLRTVRSFGWNTRLLRCAVLGVLLYRTVLVAAQDSDRTPDIEPIYSYHFQGLESHHYSYSYSYEWMSDNTLVISDMVQYLETRDTQQEVWAWRPVSVVYNPQRPNTAQTRLDPPAPEQLPTHLQMLPPTFRAPFATSPDGRLDLYRVNYSYPNDQYTLGYTPSFSVLGMVDRTTGDVMVFSNIRVGSVSDIRWSTTMDAMAMRIHGMYGDVFYAYVSQLADITQARALELRDKGSFADAMQWGIYQLYDMDSTGRYVLADGYLHSPEFDPGKMRLLIIDMETLTYEVVSAKGYFNGAGFEKPDDQRVLYMSVDGVFAYDRETKISVLVTDEVNAADTPTGDFKRFHPDFSSDGRYLAAVIASDEREDTVYVYPIPPIPENK